MNYTVYTVTFIILEESKQTISFQFDLNTFININLMIANNK